MNDYTIREATAEDVPALMRLVNTAYEVEQYFRAQIASRLPISIAV